ncbi:MAG: hypothetical protein HY900_06135 [Deltaproteobacteria bacterium]|nr:hypothetical protein [Deltaproteobacteria bacterium]
MRKPWTLPVLLACASSLLVACKAREEAAPAAQGVELSPAVSAAEAAPPLPATIEPAPTVVAAASAESTTPVPRPGVPVPTPTSASQKPPEADTKAPPAGPAPKTSEAIASPAPSPTTTPTSLRALAPTAAPPAAPALARPSGSQIVDPGGDVAVSPARAGLTRVGTEKCKICHKVQFASWAASAHAKRTPPLDCESCHGAGSEYKTLSVMKDSVKAKAAGLVQPDAAFCGRCHKGKWDPALLDKVHAHKSAS